MLLAVDAGNTNIVFGLYQGSQQKGQWRLKTLGQRSGDEYIVFLAQWLSMKRYACQDIEAVVISSVVPDVLCHFKSMVQKHLKGPLFVVGESPLKIDVPVKIENPETLGADRLVNSFEGFRRYGGPLIIIDFGTATTFDVIDHEGSYIGGVIAPGVNLSLKALYKGAAKLPPVSFARTEHIIAKTPYLPCRLVAIGDILD